MITLVITMAGLGSRFKKAGYCVPKYMIPAKGKTLFEWSLASLSDFNTVDSEYIFIVRSEDHSSKFIDEKCKNLGIHKHHVMEIDYLTSGQAETALLAGKVWDPDSELLIYNIDTYVEEGLLRIQDICGDGFIPCFTAPGKQWSFVRLDDTGRAVEVREKKRISDNCTLGAYYFKSCRLYEELYRSYYNGENHLECGERYVAPLYNYMISQGKEVRISSIPASGIHVLGTPEELEEFINL